MGGKKGRGRIKPTLRWRFEEWRSGNTEVQFLISILCKKIDSMKKNFSKWLESVQKSHNDSNQTEPKYTNLKLVAILVVLKCNIKNYDYIDTHSLK